MCFCICSLLSASLRVNISSFLPPLPVGFTSEPLGEGKGVEEGRREPEISALPSAPALPVLKEMDLPNSLGQKQSLLTLPLMSY